MKNKKSIIILLILLFIVVIGIFVGFRFYQFIFADNIKNKSDIYFYISTEATYEDVCSQLKDSDILIDFSSFDKIARKKNYPAKIKSGRYLISSNMSNNDLVNMFRSGQQSPINLTFNNIRTKLQFCNRVSEQIECNSADLMDLLNNDSVTLLYGFSTENILTMFISNTYQFYWNTSAEKFMERMFQEYQKFWNEQRRTTAEQIGLSPIEISILASIVEEENHLEKEQPIIAGLYINRLHKGMALEADPTLKFAMGDFAVKRILNKDKLIESPYNTYKYVGLPPGPIRIPSTTAINAVLHYEKHNYLFMCAKEDFSGYHNFAVTATQHAKNAARYHQALNELKIKR